MKKIIGTIFVLLTALTLFACETEQGNGNGGENGSGTDNQLNYVYNGKFTAVRATENYGQAQLTWVTLTVKDGEIESFFIDEVQIDPATNAWNVKTKKQLKEEYGMTVIPGTIQVEWYIQAEFLENYFLENSPSLDMFDQEGYPSGWDNVVSGNDGQTGVTMIIDVYTELAIEAIANWRQGKYTSFEYTMFQNYPGGPINVQYTWVNMKVRDGKISEFYVDELQSTGNVWNERSKKVLKEDYNMKPASPIEKEWYEQAETLEAFFLNQAISDVQMDKDGYAQNVTGTTMVVDNYVALALQNTTLFKTPTILQ